MTVAATVGVRSFRPLSVMMVIRELSLPGKARQQTLRLRSHRMPDRIDDRGATKASMKPEG
jgi:hypothetical protein